MCVYIYVYKGGERERDMRSYFSTNNCEAQKIVLEDMRIVTKTLEFNTTKSCRFPCVWRFFLRTNYFK